MCYVLDNASAYSALLALLQFSPCTYILRGIYEYKLTKWEKPEIRTHCAAHTLNFIFKCQYISLTRLHNFDAKNL